MFRVIAVDDEKKALDRFERIVNEDARISVVGKFTRANDALDFVKNNPVDIAFLDIEMPGMNGLDLAERLNEAAPKIVVIFITAYDNFALKAFKAHALGYLLKPLHIAAVREQLDSLAAKLDKAPEQSAAEKLTVKCFGQFKCYADENYPISWRTSKSEELFALLVHNQGGAVSKEILVDTLWPDYEPERAANNFRVTCTYIRNALADSGYTNVLLRERTSYRINPDKISCDMFDFVAGVTALNTQNPDVEALERVSQLYEAPYFANMPYEWASSKKVWLYNRFKVLQYQLADTYCNKQAYKNACSALDKILEQDPLDEEAVEKIISLLVRAGDSVQAKKTYYNYIQGLQNTLDLPPPNRLKQLFFNL